MLKQRSFYARISYPIPASFNLLYSQIQTSHIDASSSATIMTTYFPRMVRSKERLCDSPYSLIQTPVLEPASICSVLHDTNWPLFPHFQWQILSIGPAPTQEDTRFLTCHMALVDLSRSLASALASRAFLFLTISKLMGTILNLPCMKWPLTMVVLGFGIRGVFRLLSSESKGTDLGEEI